MKKRKFAFVTLSWLLFIASHDTNSQVTRTSTSLEDTEWGATLTEWYAAQATKPVTVLYKFAGRGNSVKVLVSFVDAPPPLTIFDPVTGRPNTTYYLPTIQSVEDTNGKYRLNGNSIRIEFSDHIINGTLKGSRITGELTDKQNGQKSRWAAARIPNTPSERQPTANSETSSTQNKYDSAWDIRGVPSVYPHVIHTPDRMLRPADGYRWIKPSDKSDFTVERVP